MMEGIDRKGILSKQETKHAILAFLSDSEERSNQQIVKALEPDFSKATVYKYLLNDHASLVKEGLVERKAGAAEESFRPRYRITDRGREEYHYSRMSQENINDLEKLSKEELVEKLHKRELIDDIISRFDKLSLEQRIVFFQKRKEQGNQDAADRLEKIEEGLETLRRYEKEVAEAPPDKKFNVLMKWDREIKRLRQEDE